MGQALVARRAGAGRQGIAAEPEAGDEAGAN